MTITKFALRNIYISLRFMLYMKRSKKKAVSKKNNNSRSLIIVAIIILVVGAFIYAGGLSTTGRVIDMNGEEIHEQNALTKKQLDEGVTLTGTNNYIRWTNDLDYNVPVDDVFGNSDCRVCL